MPDVLDLPPVPVGTANLRVPAIIAPNGPNAVAIPCSIDPQQLAGRSIALMTIEIVSNVPTLVAVMSDGSQQQVSLAPLIAFLQALPQTSQNIAPDGGTLPNPGTDPFPLP
jgi:hypothetical protein